MGCASVIGESTVARIRTIKPDFFTSADVCALSPLARLLFIATWCEADREGRLVWRPETFRLRYFPADDLDIDEIAQELIDRGVVVAYGDGLAVIPTFGRHQIVNGRESESRLPEPVGIDLPTRDDATWLKAPSPDAAQKAKKRDTDKARRESEKQRQDALFDQFWAAYPRKVAKPRARKAWNAIKADEALTAQIIEAVARCRQSTQWATVEFIAHPATWLNQRRWEDQVAVTVSTAPGVEDEIARTDRLRSQRRMLLQP
jgi:hypothetical protein